MVGSSGYQTFCRYKKLLDAISVPCTQQQIANKTGIKQATVHKMLHILKDEGVAKVDHFILPEGKGCREHMWIKTQKE